MLDFFVLSIVCACLFFSFSRGFIRELIIVSSIALLLYVTFDFYDFFSPIYEIFVPFEGLEVVLSLISVFVLTLIVIINLNTRLMHILAPIRLNIFDKVAGLLVGVFEGAVLSFLLFVGCMIFHATICSPAFSAGEPYSGQEADRQKLEELQKGMREMLSDRVVHGCINLSDSIMNSYLLKIIEYLDTKFEMDLGVDSFIEDLGETSVALNEYIN